MCHLVLALPLVALPVFWLLPLPAAVMIYAAVLAFSSAFYWQAMKLMYRPLQNGAEGLIGDMGEVAATGAGDMLVRVHNELWHATSSVDHLREGDRIEVVGVNGAVLLVQKLDIVARFFGRLSEPASVAVTTRGGMHFERNRT